MGFTQRKEFASLGVNFFLKGLTPMAKGNNEGKVRVASPEGTVKILKFGTPQTIAIIVLKLVKFDVTLH